MTAHQAGDGFRGTVTLFRAEDFFIVHLADGGQVLVRADGTIEFSGPGETMAIALDIAGETGTAKFSSSGDSGAMSYRAGGETGSASFGSEDRP